MKEEQSKREFKILDDRSHVLLRPGMYIGSIAMTDRKQWLLDLKKNTYSFKVVSYVPGLTKCIDEIIDNCIDVAIDSDFQKISKVSVEVSDTWFHVIDDGPGIPVIPPKTPDLKNRLCPEIAWTVKQAGTSFSENRKGPSANGVGSTCVNIFSKKFIGVSDDGKKRQQVECSDNMANIKASKPIPSSGKTGVDVYVEPDLVRFGIEKITDEHKALVYQRLVNLAICFPKLKFYFNKQQIKVNEKNFAKMFSENAMVVSSDNTTIVVFPNEYDEFKQYSYVNGLNCIRGGTQVDYVSAEICNRIRDKLIKKYKNIRPGDIKNKICLVVFLTDFKNAQFDAQTKELLSNSLTDIKHHIENEIDFNAFVKQILKNEAIINPIVETFKIKEELKSRQEIKQSKKVKVKSDKYMSSTGSKKYFLICEGLSARGGLSSALGRNGYAFYAARGVPLNAYDAKIQAISANQELKDISNILELDIFGKNDSKKISFDKIVFANDADNDGIFIASQYIGWFTRFAPNLFDEHKIARLITPLAVLRDKKDKIVKYFYSLKDFKDFEAKNDLSKFKIEYYKGLGSWGKDSFIELFDTHGFEYFLQDLKLDEEGKIYVDDWLSGEKVEKRKQYLREYTLDIEMM